MMHTCFPPLLCLFLTLCPCGLLAAEVQPERPPLLRQQVLLNAQDFVARKEMAYLAFPALLRVNAQEVLISYKRGRSHAYDTGALLEMIRFNTETQQIVERKILGEHAQHIYQMGEWIPFAGGRIGNFVDVQQVVQDRGKKTNHRVPSPWCYSDDQGKTFTPMQTWGPVAGVEYGYVFEGVLVGETTYILAMDFPELSAGNSRFDEQGRRIYGQVSVLSSADQGKSWQFVRNLSQEFGQININESSLVPLENGFLVATRGYDSQTRLHRVDQEFRTLQVQNLTQETSSIKSHIGRPRLFFHDEQLYLLGRNTQGGPMELALFRLDPATLTVQRHLVLDPAEGETVTDGYYGVPYFTGQGDETRFNVVTYRRLKNEPHPSLIRLEYRWSDVK